MKLLLAAVALMVPAAAFAQTESYCSRVGNQIVCQNYNTGAPQIAGSSSQTIHYGQQTYQVQSYGQPVYQAPPSQGIDWSLLNNAYQRR